MASQFKTASKVRANLLTLLDEVKENSDRIIITKFGVPAAVLLSFDDYQGMQATLRLLSDPKAMARIEKGRDDLKSGRFSTFQIVDGKRVLVPNSA